MKLTAVVDGTAVVLELHEATSNGSARAEIDGAFYDVEVQQVEPGIYWLRWKGRSVEISVSPERGNYVASIGKSRLPIEIIDSRAALRRALHHGHDGLVEIRAPMPGKVIRVLVAEGQEVQANQGIVVVEAMKMQNEIKSPKGGVVKKMAVAEGITVSSGDLLATVE